MRPRTFKKLLRTIPAAALATTLVSGCNLGDENTNVSVAQSEKALRGVKGLVGETSTKAKLPITAENPQGRIKLAKDVYIHLANSQDAGEGKEIKPGLVAFSGKEWTANAVQATKAGELRLLNVITDKRADTEFKYRLDMPKGYELSGTDDGPAIITNAEGEVIHIFPKPWARDARGREVETSYHSYTNEDGSYSLFQQVWHQDGDYAYPIVADPWWAVVMKVVSGVAAKTPTPYALAWCVGNGIMGYFRSDQDGLLRFVDGAVSCVTIG